MAYADPDTDFYVYGFRMLGNSSSFDYITGQDRLYWRGLGSTWLRISQNIYVTVNWACHTITIRSSSNNQFEMH